MPSLSRRRRCNGLPVRFYLARVKAVLFFRKLTGDSRVNAYAASVAGPLAEECAIS